MPLWLFLFSQLNVSRSKDMISKKRKNRKKKKKRKSHKNIIVINIVNYQSLTEPDEDHRTEVLSNPTSWK